MRRVLWPLTVGLLVTAICGAALWESVVLALQEPVARIMPAILSDRVFHVSLDGLTAAVIALPGLVVALVLALYRRGHRSADAEPRCRTCGQILRGLTEPRCPECGTRI